MANVRSMRTKDTLRAPPESALLPVASQIRIEVLVASQMAVRLVVVLALLSALRLRIAKLVERYGGLAIGLCV